MSCRGKSDNLMIDRMVALDCHRGKRNLSMAWVDVKKAYDSVDHNWLLEIMEVHRFPSWLCRVMRCLVVSWNIRIVTTTKRGPETSRCIRFNRDLPQGDSLCPRLLTLSLNPIAWSLEAQFSSVYFCHFCYVKLQNKYIYKRTTDIK